MERETSEELALRSVGENALGEYLAKHVPLKDYTSLFPLLNAIMHGVATMIMSREEGR